MNCVTIVTLLKELNGLLLAPLARCIALSLCQAAIAAGANTALGVADSGPNPDLLACKFWTETISMLSMCALRHKRASRSFMASMTAVVKHHSASRIDRDHPLTLGQLCFLTCLDPLWGARCYKKAATTNLLQRILYCTAVFSASRSPAGCASKKASQRFRKAFPQYSSAQRSSHDQDSTVIDGSSAAPLSR